VFERIHRMLVKEFIQIFRDPRMRGVIFLMPVIQLLVFSYAVTTDVRHVAAGVYDRDNSAMSRDLVARFADSGYFEIKEYVGDDRRAADLMDRGAVRVILRTNKGFENAVRAGRTAQVQILVDGADSNTAAVALAYAARIAARFSQELLDARARRLTGSPIQVRGVDVRTRAWFNPNLESRMYYVPGLIVIIVTLVTLMLTGMAVVREKEIGTMEQIMVTPIRPVEFILGKTVPFSLISYVDAAIVMLVAVLWFHVPLRGSVVLLFVCITLYLMTTLGIGLLISTISQTQQQAMMTTFFFFLPAILLSGFMFPIANMPRAAQWLTYLNPMRYFLEIVRGIFLKGVGLRILWPQMVPLALIGAATLALASLRFRKTLA
jgi:ABC-2 type transport system permease protein